MNISNMINKHHRYNKYDTVLVGIIIPSTKCVKNVITILLH